MDTFKPLCFGQRGQCRDERGFSLIEIVVAIFLLAVVSAAVLPLLVQGMRLSSTNATLAAASQLAIQQIELVRPQSLCSAILPATTTVTTQGVTLQVSRTVGSSCPTIGYPITVPVSVSVTRTDTGLVVASAKTLVFVTGP
jgi:prepilin-type N-terminal cleavage/methylation domain-containing protein